MAMNEFEQNLACKEAIESAVGANYADNRLDSKAAVRQVLDQFGADRVAYVLAVTIKAKAESLLPTNRGRIRFRQQTIGTTAI